MGIKQIIEEVDAEIARLQQAKALLTGEAVKRSPSGPKAIAAAVAPAKKKRNLTPEGRARIAAAVKARWAKQKKAAK
jgi:hypothetical protein